MYFIRNGSGFPPLVFVHGFACAHDDWRAQLDSFSSRHEVIACDLRGHGATPGHAHECTIAHYGGDVAALIANLDLKGAVLLGHSMGCRVVLEAARLDPARIGGIVLLDGSMVGMGDAAQADAVIRQMKALPDFATFADALFSQMFLQQSAVSRAIVARARSLPAEVGSALYESFARWDVEHMRAALAAVRAPLLAIQSTWVDAARKRVPLQTGQTTPWLDLVRSSVPGARIEVIANAGHFPQIERATEVNRLFETFVEGLVR
jgi:pimeloyl-ACP methyl ester carboxylesterase